MLAPLEITGELAWLITPQHELNFFLELNYLNIDKHIFLFKG